MTKLTEWQMTEVITHIDVNHRADCRACINIRKQTDTYPCTSCELVGGYNKNAFESCVPRYESFMNMLDKVCEGVLNQTEIEVLKNKARNGWYRMRKEIIQENVDKAETDREIYTEYPKHDIAEDYEE